MQKFVVAINYSDSHSPKVDFVEANNRAEALGRIIFRHSSQFRLMNGFSVEMVSPDLYSKIHMNTVKEDVIFWLNKGEKIKAIKRVRELTGWGLKEAKEYVDQVEEGFSMGSFGPS